MLMKGIGKIKQQSAQNQIVLTCVTFTFVAMIVIGMFYSFALYKKSLEATYDKMTIYVDKTKENVEQMFALIENTAHSVAGSKTIMNWIDNPQSLNTESKDFYKSVNSLDEEIKYILSYSSAFKADLVAYVSVFVDDKLINYTYAKPISTKKILSGASYAYSRLANESGTEFIEPMEEGGFLYYALKLKYDYSSDKSLVILIATDEDVLKKHYNGAIATEDTHTYLIHESGIIFSSTEQNHGQEFQSKFKVNNSSNIYYKNKKFLAMARKMKGDKFIFLYLVPHNFIVLESFSQFPLFVCIAIVLSILIALIGIIISKKVTSFIKDLTESMEQVSNANYAVKMQRYNNDAINNISDTFNSMTTEIEHLIETTYESKIMLQEMEFKLLQQQMNPHFLFNILLVIQIKAKLSSDESVYNMLTSLSGLLRGSLYSDKNIYTTLEQELKYVNFYLYLQQQRFSEKLKYSIEIPQELKQLKVPRLTIEPIVENSVVHGVEDNESVVSIKVLAKQENNDLIIEIIDDGKGFNVKEFEIQDLSVKDSTSRENIGLSNINSRLKRLYGNEYGLIIYSEKGKGTNVIIRIPKDYC